MIPWMEGWHSWFLEYNKGRILTWCVCVCVIAVDLVFHPHILQAKPCQNPKLKKLNSSFQNRDFGFVVQAYSK
jgi:hypothetical protein